jgi:hypothetical protein
VPKVAATTSTTDAAATTSRAAASRAAASGAAATTSAATTTSAAAATTATTPGLCGCISGRNQHARYANGGDKIDAEQRGCCQTARQEFPSSVLFFPGHFTDLPDTL